MTVADAGIIGLKLGFDPIPGMATHAESFPFPVAYKTVSGQHLVQRILHGDDGLYREILDCAVQLVHDGVSWLGTSCGYFSAYQRQLAEELPLPVFTSPLIQIPSILASMSSNQRIAVLWASCNGAMIPALEGAGLNPADTRLVHLDLDKPGMFRDAILSNKVPLDPRMLHYQIADTCRDLVAEHPDLGGLVLECGDLMAYAAAAQAASGLPVWDYRTLFTWAASAVCQPTFATDSSEVALKSAKESS